MIRLVLPLALVVALGFVLAAPAEAAPVTGLVPHGPIAGGRVAVNVGFGVAAPVHRHVAPRVRHAHRPRGHWEIVEQQIWVPGRVIGYDAYGVPIHTQGHYVVEARRIWVPHRRRAAVRRVRAVPYANVTVGRVWR